MSLRTIVTDGLRRVLDRLTGDSRYPGTQRVPHIGRTQAGVPMTPDLALRQATVWACCRYLSQAVAGLPVKVLRPQTVGGAIGASQAISHNVTFLLGTEPSAEWTPFRFRETLMHWALLWGNGYAEIEFDRGGRAIGLWPIHPERVRPMRSEDGELFFRVYSGPGFVTADGVVGYVDMPQRSMFHLAGFGDGPIGVNVVEYAAQTIGWAAATELFGASFFGDGMQMAGVVSLTGTGQSDSLRRMRAELEGIHNVRRGGRAHRWAFLDRNATVTKMSATPNEAQFIDALQFQTEQVCRWFGVPPSKVQHLLRSTYSNIESQAIEVVVDAIMPWTIRFEEECNRRLFGQNRQGLFVKLDLKGLLRGDFATRQTGLQTMFDRGVISGNEWRDYEDMGPMPAGAGGDKRLVPLNMTTLDQIGIDAPPPGGPDNSAVARLERQVTEITTSRRTEARTVARLVDDVAALRRAR